MASPPSPSPSPSPPTGLKALNAKHYIAAALMATVAAAVIVTVFFVLLSPARIYFSVTKASRYRLLEDGVGLNLTLAANNTSHRAAVKYQSLFVVVANNSDFLYWIRAQINLNMSHWHRHGSLATIDATVTMLMGERWQASFAGGDMVRGAAAFVVQVNSAARFRVAGIPTRLYQITVICGPITFVTGSPAAPPVDCSPV